MHFAVLIGGGICLALIGCLGAFLSCSENRDKKNEDGSQASKEDALLEKIFIGIQMLCMPILAPLLLLDKYLPNLDQSVQKRWNGEYKLKPEDQAYVNHTRDMERKHGANYWKMLQNNKFDYKLHKQNVQDDVQEELDAV